MGKVLAVAVSSQFLTLKENVDRCDHNCGHREPQNINVAAEIMVCELFFKTLHLGSSPFEEGLSLFLGMLELFDWKLLRFLVKRVWCFMLKGIFDCWCL